MESKRSKFDLDEYCDRIVESIQAGNKIQMELGNLHGNHINQPDDQVVQMSHHSLKSVECLDMFLL